jgi:hypothetical protein
MHCAALLRRIKRPAHESAAMYFMAGITMRDWAIARFFTHQLPASASKTYRWAHCLTIPCNDFIFI